MAAIGVPAESARPARRDWLLTAIGALYALLALSDFTKILQHHNDPGLGLVVLGHRLTAPFANVVGGVLFGIFLASYAYGLLKHRRWIQPISVLYALYVPMNLSLFWSLHDNPRPAVGFIVGYLIIAIGGSVGTALYVAYRRDLLD